MLFELVISFSVLKDHMNSKRRSRLQEGIDILDEVIVEEQEAFDNMPENIRDAEKGQAVEEGLDNLNEAKDLLDEVASSLVIMIRFLICILTGTLIRVSGDLLWVRDRLQRLAFQTELRAKGRPVAGIEN